MKSLIKFILRLLTHTFYWSNYDSSSYWKKRAKEEGEKAVLFKNKYYNQCVRQASFQIIDPLVNSLPSAANVLDIGCGIGIVSKHMAELNTQINIDAVDFSEMIQRIEKKAEEKITYISSSAEEFLNLNKKYDLIVSSGCISAIRNIQSLEKSLDNLSKMIKKDGQILFIDPFHRWRFLMRAPYSSQMVVSFLKSRGMLLEKKSGILFWPYREFLANSTLSEKILKRRFSQGEKLLNLFGAHLWADYKVLLFRKN